MLQWSAQPFLGTVLGQIEKIMRLFLLLLTPIPLYCAAQKLTPVWVEAGRNKLVLARVVVERGSECPSISIGNAAPVAMHLRQPAPKHFQPICEFEIPPGTKRASVENQKLALPVDNPSRIAVIGDTGCRLKGDRIQACNDPAEWPFASVAAKAAGSKSQLVIHVGDYLYRESPCPPGDEKQCGGSPSGDNWEAWNADFFTPARALLAAAPWAFSRGNHESCSRSWMGWYYYLDPRPFPETCSDYSEPYLVTLGTFQLLMVDSSAAKDPADPAQVARYTALLKPFASTNAWLVEHHPMWGLQKGARAAAPDAPLLAVMQQAYDGAGFAHIGLILAGHQHLFEILSYTNGRPPQIVAGDAGTMLADQIRKDLKGETVFGTTVETGQSRHQFGFTFLERKRQYWEVELKGPSGKVAATCRIEGKAVHCKGSPQ